jgi:predicted permease
MDPDLLTRRDSGWLSLVGRLRPGMTMERARAGLATLSTQMASAWPELAGLVISPYPLSRVDPRAWPLLRNAAALLMGVVGLVLLIAAANVANLLLARAVARRREIALRLALGGSRVRLVRQLLTETLLLAAGGAALGVLAASWSLQALTQAIPSTGIFSFNLDLPIDWRVAAFTTGVTVMATLFAGLAPALQASNPGLLPALKDADPLGGGGRLRLRGQRALVVGQLALSLMLLVIAGLFLKSLWRAQAASPGFDVDSVATASLRIELLRYTRVQGQQFYRDVVERAMALPGVSAASVARVVPLSGGGRTTPLQIEGQVVPDAPAGGGSPRRPLVATNVVGTRYFETMGIGLVAGRDFSGRDVEGAPPAVVVNESFVARYFPGEQALGKRIAVGGGTDPAWREIVGIVRDSAYRTIAELPTPFVYQPVAQQHETGMTLLVRTERDPALIVGELRRMLVSLEPNAPVTSVQPLSALVSSALYPARMGARLMAVFGVIAVSLAAVGLYGVAAFAVSRRTREMGIRTALGARQRDLMTLVLRESLTVVSIGIALGAVGAGLLAQLLRGFLYGISPTDPLVFGSVALLLALVMLGATGLPARRASKTDPLTALRVE